MPAQSVEEELAELVHLSKRQNVSDLTHGHQKNLTGHGLDGLWARF